MALRILPFRQYNENDVVNLFASATANASTTGTGAGDAGVFVKVSAGDFSAEPISYGTNSYLGKTDYPHVLASYPSVNLKFAPATAADSVLGITLMQTAETDENGQKLLYYKQKALELQAALPGQAVPVATKGIFTLTSGAYDGSLTVGTGIKISANAGKVTGVAPGGAGQIGSVIGTNGTNVVIKLG